MALDHLDAVDQSETAGDVIRAAASDDDVRDVDEGEGMTRHALALLGSRRRNRYEVALAALRQDTRDW